jgi:putative solute:sodium symporter small subunit
MDNSTDDYHISFFKPTTPQAVANRNMVIWLVMIWFIAIFGFQILLKIIEKPTPEASYIAYQNVWENIKSGTAGEKELIDFGRTTLSVLGKVMISPTERQILDNALSWTVYQLIDESEKSSFTLTIKKFEEIKADIEDISDPNYIQVKTNLSRTYSPVLNLSNLDVRSKILPLELNSASPEVLTEEVRNSLPGIMEKYLVHNQSFLTDFKFLGFPFHYFYTAMFLLILFVGLCWLYCVKTDSLNAKLNIVD